MKHPDHDKILAALNGDVIQEKKDALATDWTDMDTSNEDAIRKAIGDIVYRKECVTRIKPRTIMIGGTEVPEPMRVEPDSDETCWFINLSDHLIAPLNWRGSEYQQRWLKTGLLQATEQGAQQMLAALVKQLEGVL